MPYTPTSPTLLLAGNLASYVLTAWGASSSPPGSNDGVDWDYFRRYGDKDDLATAQLQGRQVVFFPTGYAWDFENRGQEGYTHRISCLVVERYTDAAGDPPRDWTSARVDFVHTFIVKGLRFTRSGPPSFNLMLRTLAADTTVCDVEKLATGGRLFFALSELEFVELVS